MQRNPTQACPADLTSPKIFHSICVRLTEPRGAHFSPAEDVLAFRRLIHLTTDQSSSLETFKINNTRGRTGCIGE
jgi:hypothetical protein